MAQDETLELLRKYPAGISLNQLHDNESDKKVCLRDLHALQKWKYVEKLESTTRHDIWRALTEQELEAYNCRSCGRRMFQTNKMCGICRRASGRIN